eukprot:scaffold19344_cov94-Isochrysis_galbana.AAC.1
MTDPPIDHTQAREQARRSRHARRQTTRTCPRPHRGRAFLPSRHSPTPEDGRGPTWSKAQTWLRVRVLARVAPLLVTRPTPRLARHPIPHPPASSTELHPPFRPLRRRSILRRHLAHPSPQLRRSALLVSLPANECRRNHPPSPSRPATSCSSTWRRCLPRRILTTEIGTYSKWDYRVGAKTTTCQRCHDRFTDRHRTHQRPGAKRSRNVTRRHTHTSLHGPTGGVPSDKARSDMPRAEQCEGGRGKGGERVPSALLA